jgi:transposase-like protein
LIERCLQAELSTHLGYEKNQRAEEARPNHRNGYIPKTLKSDAGALEEVYPIVYVDCLVLKVRENQRIPNKALSLALGMTMEGKKEVLGMWISENEGARILAGRLYGLAQSWE